jgi:hypothetical protein
MGRQRSVLSYRAIRQSRLGMALLHAIPTATSSRSANTLKSPSTGSTTAVNLANDKPEDVRNFLGSAREAIRSLVRRAIKRADIRRTSRLMISFGSCPRFERGVGSLLTSFFRTARPKIQPVPSSNCSKPPFCFDIACCRFNRNLHPGNVIEDNFLPFGGELCQAT